MMDFKLDENKIVSLHKTDGVVRIFHVNSDGEFIGVAEIDEKDFATILESFVPAERRVWR